MLLGGILGSVCIAWPTLVCDYPGNEMGWTVDTSGHAVATDEGVKHSGEKGAEKKGNAIWQDEQGAEGVYCWRFNILGGSNMWLGVSTEDKFGPGWALKGLLYGGPGNLAAGGGLISGHWGPKLVAGDVIDMRLEVSGDHTTLAFSKNGAGLGIAYDIKGWSWSGAALRPVVSLSNPEDSISMSSIADCGLESMLLGKDLPPGIAGDWEVEGEDTWCLAIDQEGDKQWWVAAMVGNTISCAVTKTDGGVFSPGPVMGSRMMAAVPMKLAPASGRMLPPPRFKALEDSVTKLLTGLTNIAREGDKLVITAGDRVEKFSAAPGSVPVTKDQVSWMNE